MNIIYDVINENNPNDNFETNSNNSNKDYIKNLFSRTSCRPFLKRKSGKNTRI